MEINGWKLTIESLGSYLFVTSSVIFLSCHAWHFMHLNFNNVSWIPPQSLCKTELQDRALCKPGQSHSRDQWPNHSTVSPTERKVTLIGTAV